MDTLEVKEILDYIQDCQDFEKALSAQGKELLQNLRKPNNMVKKKKQKVIKRGKYSVEQLKQAYNLKAEGKGLKDIARMTGIDLRYLYNIHTRLKQRLARLGVQVDKEIELEESKPLY